jgi:hypothetical protein
MKNIKKKKTFKLLKKDLSERRRVTVQSITWAESCLFTGYTFSNLQTLSGFVSTTLPSLHFGSYFGPALYVVRYIRYPHLPSLAQIVGSQIQ